MILSSSQPKRLHTMMILEFSTIFNWTLFTTRFTSNGNIQESNDIIIFSGGLPTTFLNQNSQTKHTYYFI